MGALHFTLIRWWERTPGWGWSSMYRGAASRRVSTSIGKKSEPMFGKGMRRSTFSEKRGFSVNEGFGKDSTGKAIQ